MSQRISNRRSARAAASTTSPSIEVQQTYNMNVYDASRRSGRYSGSLTGELARVQRRRHRRIATSTSTARRARSLRGGTPRILASRGERPLFGSPVYFSVNSEFTTWIVERKSDTTLVDQSLTRFDLFPRCASRSPSGSSSRSTSTAGYRDTYWTESRDAQGVQIDEPITRHYYDLPANMTGPGVQPDLEHSRQRLREKLKHSIEPYFNVERVSAIDDFDQIVQIDSTDSIVGKHDARQLRDRQPAVQRR